MKELFSEYMSELSEFLKKHNFKKSGNSFYLKEEENWAVINVQKSKSADMLKFTFNIGIFSSALSDFYEEGVVKKPTVHDLHWSKRIGHFLPEKIDLWFELSDQKQLQSALNYSIFLLENFVLTELTTLISDNGLESLWLTNENSCVTEFQRLLNLSVFLSKRHAPETSKVLDQLKKYAREKQLSIEYHLKKLHAKYGTT